MSFEENKTISRRSYEEPYNKGNLDIADEITDENVIDHSPMGDIKGREALKQMDTMLINTFADLRVKIEDQIAEGDKVVNRITFTGIHKGEYMGIAPTGKSVTITGISIQKIVNGKILEIWGIVDSLSLLQQIGAVSLPGQK